MVLSRVFLGGYDTTDKFKDKEFIHNLNKSEFEEIVK